MMCLSVGRSAFGVLKGRVESLLFLRHRSARIHARLSKRSAQRRLRDNVALNPRGSAAENVSYEVPTSRPARPRAYL